MIAIRATYNELEVAGTPAELRAVQGSLATLQLGQRLRLPADIGIVAEPYDRPLASLEAIATEGPVRVAVDQDRLVVTGSPSMLAVFASFFDFHDSDPPGNHRHHGAE